MCRSCCWLGWPPEFSCCPPRTRRRSAIAAAALIGLGLGGEADITPYLLTRYFGLRSFSTLYGFTWTAYAIAGAIGPVIMGRAFDLTGSYALFLSVLAAGGLISAFLMLTMPQYDRATPTLRLPHRQSRHHRRSEMETSQAAHRARIRC